MKILVAADFHGNLNSARLLGRSGLGAELGGKVDTAVLCGDLSEFGSLDKGLAVLNEVRKGFERIFYVTGNHDPPSLMKLGVQVSSTQEWSRVDCLHGKTTKFGGLTFIGLSGFFPPFYGKWDIEGLPITREDEAFKFLDRLFAQAVKSSESEQGQTVLVTHDPPYGVTDLSVLTKTNAGSHGIRDAILKWKPVAAFCGHIHEGRGIVKLGETLIVNPGSMHFRQMAYVEIGNERGIEAELTKI